MSFAVRACALLLLSAPALAQVNLTGAPVQQNFDSLANTGTSSVLPPGWAFLESGADTNYTATDGSATSGDTYSVGSTGSTERALGSLSSNSTQVRFGAQLRNQTGSTLGTLSVSYVAEEWRLGDTVAADRLDFQFSTDATTLADGTWTDLNTLDAVSPVNAGTAGPLDGNATANKVAVSGDISGLSVANGGTFWIRWIDPNVGGADDLLAIDDVVLSTTGAVDFTPAVSSTVPINGATGVAGAANLTINFTESVTTSPGWFTLNCTAGGSITYVATGAGASRSVDPDINLAFGDSCTATVVAANVTDLDGTADAMTSNLVFTFTVAPDVAPTVSSTVPANSATNVGVTSNIAINFSEPVTATGSWFAISCASSGAHPATVSGGPQSYALNPNADFVLDELCTVNLTAALIVDQDGAPDPLGSNFSFVFTTAASASNYYSSVNASSATTLRTTLHAVIDDHTRIAYTNGSPNTWVVLNLADQDPVDNTKILDVYKNASYTKIPGGQGPYNREHTWPNSLGFGDNNDGAPANLLNYPYTDTHMLYASDVGYNSNRGNKYYGTCNASCTEDPTNVNHGQGGGTGTYPGNSNWYNGVLYEVWGKRKGDMARAMFYMDIRYEGGTHGVTGGPEPNLHLTDDPGEIENTGGNASEGYMGLRSVLLQWHAQDPVTEEEVLRNDIVFSYQGNRNPFIDHPEWVACIYQSTCSGSPPDNVFANGFEN